MRIDESGLPAWDARKLLRAARSGTLATASGGQPFASLVTPACAPDGSMLMLLSDLSEHTKHLRVEARCSIMVTGRPADANPQTAPRVTITGHAVREADPTLKQRWLALHPYAAMYADFGDFSLWRVQPLAGLYVGGFARAHRLRAGDLTPDPDARASILAAEAGIIAHCNADHADTMDLLARHAGGTGEGWRMVVADAEGCDLASGEQVLRVAWTEPADDAGAIRKELIRLAGAARKIE